MNSTVWRLWRSALWKRLIIVVLSSLPITMFNSNTLAISLRFLRASKFTQQFGPRAKSDDITERAFFVHWARYPRLMTALPSAHSLILAQESWVKSIKTLDFRMTSEFKRHHFTAGEITRCWVWRDLLTSFTLLFSSSFAWSSWI